MFDKVMMPTDLDINGLAMAYGLLHLPRMPELRGREIVTLSDFNPDMIPYKCVRFFVMVVTQHLTGTKHEKGIVNINCHNYKRREKGCQLPNVGRCG